MTRTFTSATDEASIEMINRATDRLAVIAPGVTTPVAEAVAARMNDLPHLSLTIILDSDPEVYRMGYGDVEALAIIQKASNDAHFDLREQSGVRIGVVISDDRTMIYAPVSRNVEAGSTSADHPNAIVLGEDTATKLAAASGLAHDVQEPVQEVGKTALSKEKVDGMTRDLKKNLHSVSI